MDNILKFEPTDLEALTQQEQTSQHARKPLVCAACANSITRHELRIDAAGAHQHTFTNPAGFTYTIGCFSEAPGCVQSGVYTAEWSWFMDHEWRYTHCRECQTHLGWHFRGADQFFGLILDLLVEPH